jgi:hypothetical protein
MVGYVLAAGVSVEQSKAVDFQRALLDNGLEFSQTNIRGRSFALARLEPSNLQIKLDSPAPQISNIQVIANNPSYDLEMFARDTVAVMESVRQTWPAEQYQVIRSSAKVQHLYSSREHAFKYLWETRLGQSSEDFAALGGRPVAGGGIRLTMPPHKIGDEEPCSIELRIESSPRELNKLLVETAFVWPKPVLIRADDTFDTTARLRQLEQYAANEVWNFLA